MAARGVSGHNLDWAPIASSSDGSRLAAAVRGGDIWTPYDPSLAPAVPSISNNGNTAGNTTPDTGYGYPISYTPFIVGVIVSALFSLTGFWLLRTNKERDTLLEK